MEYNTVLPGRFLARPNRFIAHIEIDGKTEICHVKNTGRCRELLLPGAEVYVVPATNPDRKTRFDLVAVRRGEAMINIDSIAPNLAFGKWVEKSGFFGKLCTIRPECTFRSSRFDFYLETDAEKIFCEVKGVTLTENGIVRFPDAPTERGSKHLRELMECIRSGFSAHVFFIAQMEDVQYFTPNRTMDPVFADTLLEAARLGVGVHCLSCNVTPSSMEIKDFVPVQL